MSFCKTLIYFFIFFYTFIIDTNIKSTKPTDTAGNIFVIAYKTAGLTRQRQEGVSPLTEEVGATDNSKFKAKILNDFDFLNTPETPSDPTQPSLCVVYDTIKANIAVYYFVTNGTETNIQSVFTSISPNKNYRIGVVVSDSRIELYVDGKFASSKIYPGKTLHGTDNDILISTPSKYQGEVSVANCFQVGRVVSSGEIRSMGGPSTFKLS